MKFRKKSIEVEACLIHDDHDYDTAPDWVILSSTYNELYNSVTCNTQSGEIEARLPTWIIKEHTGDGCYPCTIEKFDELYEKI
jgi:hypothetical protein